MMMHGCDDARHARKLFSKFKYYNMFVFYILYKIIIVILARLAWPWIGQFLF
jgi:hypothetical protein